MSKCNGNGVTERIRYLTLTDASKVWMPDTFFRNEKIGQFHNILTPNLYIRIFPDGDVLYSIRWGEEQFISGIQIFNSLINKFNAKFSSIN